MEIEKNNKKEKNKNKKKRIIITLLLILFVISLVLCFFLGTFIYKKMKEKFEPQNGNVNKLYIEEKVGGKEEENVLTVELEEENKVQNNNQSNETNTNTNVSVTEPKKPVNAPYYIKVNYGANVVTVYKKDSKGKYTVPIKAMICSCGTATPKSGVYPISDKYTWRLLEGNVYGQYACRIVGSILFHSVPYEQKDKSTLEWWEYDKLGTTASLGCIRLKVEDAKWIYNNCIPGTKVEFYKDSIPGPLGKPTAKKITQDTEVRNWDPTDPDAENPWKEYLKNQNSKPTTNPDNNTNTGNNNEINNQITNNTVNNNTTNNNTTNNSVNNNNVNNNIDNNNTNQDKEENTEQDKVTNKEEEKINLMEGKDVK